MGVGWLGHGRLDRLTGQLTKIILVIRYRDSHVFATQSLLELRGMPELRGWWNRTVLQSSFSPRSSPQNVIARQNADTCGQMQGAARV